MLNWSYFLQALFGLIFIVIAIVIFTIGPIIVSIIMHNPWYLFTYIISWAPALLFYFIAKILVGNSTNGK